MANCCQLGDKYKKAKEKSAAAVPFPRKDAKLIIDQLSSLRSGNYVPGTWHKGYNKCVYSTHIVAIRARRNAGMAKTGR